MAENTTDTAAPGDAATAPAGPLRRRVPLALVLVGGITLLILLSAGSVLFISLREASENTFSLLADKADSNLDLLQAQLQTLLSPAEAAGTEIARRIGDSKVTADDPDHQLHHILRGALSALPHATGMIFIDRDGKAVRIARLNDRITEVSESPALRERQQYALKRARTLNRPGWVEPVWMPMLGEPVLSFLAPVTRDNEFYGVVVISTRLGELANFLATIEQERGVRAFVLYGDRFVLGHPDLLKQGRDMAAKVGEVALPTIETFKEDAFRLLRSDAKRARRLMATAHIDDAPYDNEYVVLIRKIHDYGPEMWQIGLRLPQGEVFTEVDRLIHAGVAGLVILAVAAAAGYWLTRHLNLQIGRLATTAERLRNLDVASLPRLPESRLRELSNAAGAFNALIAAMHWFETYVPKTLVLRLMRSGDSAVRSSERTLTIMFTDIRGFSTLVEHMSPSETADFLNRHFAVLADCVEAEGGTVDKFIGDSVMAFWGAPENQPDHAARALRTVLAMQRALADENMRGRDTGAPPIAIRIGVHTGPVTVGNIGSQNRLNYTVIGDTVNVAARLESYAKEVSDGADCVALISGATLHAAGDAAPAGATLEPLGEVAVRGREGKVDVFLLKAD